MLRHLEIRDMLLIDRLALDFAPGLNVLTGETGAGKSILLDCLGFVLGWRGRAELVRQGANQGEVMAEFDLPAAHPVWDLLRDAGHATDGELILRRTNARDGRKTGYVNDRRVSGEMLRAISEKLVELHGQHDDRGLLNPASHRAVLDQFSGHDGAGLRQAWSTFRKAEKLLAAAEAVLAEERREEEFLRHAVAELEDFGPEPGEDARLDVERRRMQASARHLEDVTRALTALGPQGAEGSMMDAGRWLEGAVIDNDPEEDPEENPLARGLAALSRASIELGEAYSEVEAALATMAFDPTQLDQTEERLFALRALARKHEVTPDELAPLAETLRSRLEGLDAGETNLAHLRDALKAAEADYETAAERVSTERKAAAQALDAAMALELAPLKMERAIFTTQVNPAPPGPEGRDAVAFSVATNPGAPSGPIDRIASGGELSRFLLALKVSLARGTDAQTLIFDEIDRGVGGATADAVGRRLARLSETTQVLVVTHSPQVASLGQRHFRVAKSVIDDMTTTDVVALNTAERVDEIARMISGDRVTEAARSAAKVLIKG